MILADRNQQSTHNHEVLGHVRAFSDLWFISTAWLIRQPEILKIVRLRVGFWMIPNGKHTVIGRKGVADVLLACTSDHFFQATCRGVCELAEENLASLTSL